MNARDLRVTASGTGSAHAVEGSVAVSGVVIGDVIVGSRHYAVEEFSSSEPVFRLNTAPSRLLAARHRVVPFDGRESELTELAVWRDDAAVPAAVRLVHGQGGQGKTRLANQFAEHSAEVGWQVVTVRATRGPSLPRGVAAPNLAADVLVVIDYAERWPVTDLVGVLGDRLFHRGQHRVRFLLLSRPAGLWWASLRHAIRDAGMDADARELGRLDGTSEHRDRTFAAAAVAFAARLGAVEGEVPEPPPYVTGETVLGTHMAALAAVDAHVRGTQPPLDPLALSAYLVDREIAQWTALHDSGRIRTSPEQLSKAVFAISLLGPLAQEDAVTALEQARVCDADVVLDDHRFCYPPDEPEIACTPPVPDRLAEDFVGLLTPGHPVAEHQPAAWAKAVVARLLGQDGESSEYAANVLVTLIEAAGRWPHLTTRVLNPLLGARPDHALQAGGTAMVRLTGLAGVDGGVLAEIDHLIPADDPEFHAASAAIAGWLAPKQQEDTPGDPVQRALLHGELGYRLARIGHYEDALTETDSALTLWAASAGASAGRYDAETAAAHANRAAILMSAGHYADAAAANATAIGLLVALGASGEHDLARALANQVRIAAEAGDHLGAQEAGLRAVACFERLEPPSPAEHATALGALATAVSRLDGPVAALPFADRAVEVSTRSLPGNASRAALARARHGLAGLLRQADRLPEALAEQERAVSDYELLQAVDRRLFAPEHVDALINQCVLLIETDRGGEAIGVSERVLEVLGYRTGDEPPLLPVKRALAAAHGLGTFAGVRALAGEDLDRAWTAVEQALRLYHSTSATVQEIHRAEIEDAEQTRDLIARLREMDPVS